MRTISALILHCTACKFTPETSAQQAFGMIRQWHLYKGWRDIGYHYYIHSDGTLLQGRLNRDIGAHCQGKNSTSIGICLEGLLREDFTTAQFATLEKLCLNLMDSYNLMPEDIYGHNEFSNKKCPVFSVEAFKSQLISKY